MRVPEVRRIPRLAYYYSQIPNSSICYQSQSGFFNLVFSMDQMQMSKRSNSLRQSPEVSQKNFLVFCVKRQHFVATNEPQEPKCIRVYTCCFLATCSPEKTATP